MLEGGDIIGKVKVLQPDRKDYIGLDRPVG